MTASQTTEPPASVVGASAPIPTFPQTGEGDAGTDGFTRRTTI